MPFARQSVQYVVNVVNINDKCTQVTWSDVLRRWMYWAAFEVEHMSRTLQTLRQQGSKAVRQ